MKDAEGYDVLRLIEHGRGCYVSSDYVEGIPLIRWVKDHPGLPKEQLFLWIHEMAKQLECIHRCRGNPCYRYVNPYSMIITRKKELYFLDLGAQANEHMLSVMTRRNVRELFLPPGDVHGQRESISLDIYGLGKTIQFLLSVSEPDPALTKKEEIRFQNLISRSLDGHTRRAYTSVPELQKQIPTYHISGRFFSKARILLLLAALTVTASGIIVSQKEPGDTGIEDGLNEHENVLREAPAAQEEKEEEQEEQEQQEEQKDQEGQETKDSSLLKKELGFLYFLDKRDYRKSREYFAQDRGDGGSQALARLSEYMLMGDVSGKEGEVETLLHQMEQKATGVMQEEYYRCMIRGYGLLDSQDAARAVLRLGQECMGYADEEAVHEITGSMAASYERTGEIEKAAETYMDMLAWEKEEHARESIYIKLVGLREENGEAGDAESICRQGAEELEHSKELRLLHIRLLCADKKVKRRICARKIAAYLEEVPEMAEEEEFQKLEKEYRITRKGEDICVGK